MHPRILVASTGSALADPDCEVEWVSPLVVTSRFAEVKRALGRLGEARTIALTSGNAVDALVGALRALGHDVRSLFGIKLAAVGEGTAARLAELGLQADLTARGGGQALAHEILAADFPDPIWHLRALDARPELVDTLVAAGRRVEVIVAYETTPDRPALSAARARHAERPFAAIALTSPAGARALVENFGDKRLAGVLLGAIGETTRIAVTELCPGSEVVVPDTPSLRALIADVSARLRLSQAP